MQNPKLIRYANTIPDLGLAAEPRRIVSLVPSITESLFAVGLGDRVVGVTDWCIHPASELGSVSRVGGTKNPRIEDILKLKPELVIANHEENRKVDVDRLLEHGLPVWVSYPRNVLEGIALLEELVALGASENCVRALVEPMRGLYCSVVSYSAGHARPKVFCAIWKNPWMSIGTDTYVHDIITQCGGENVCANHADSRYPRISIDELVAYDPEVILLPDEPYPFTEADRMQLLELPITAAAKGRVHLLDGTLLSWYGPRIGRGLQAISELLHLGEGFGE